MWGSEPRHWEVVAASQHSFDQDTAWYDWWQNIITLHYFSKIIFIDFLLQSNGSQCLKDNCKDSSIPICADLNTRILSQDFSYLLAHSFLCSFQRAFSINISFILTLRRIVHGNKYPKLLIPLAQAHHTSGREEIPPAQACKLKSRALSFSRGGRGEKERGHKHFNFLALLSDHFLKSKSSLQIFGVFQRYKKDCSAQFWSSFSATI